jgi:tRNA(adenine34) deaminase
MTDKMTQAALDAEYMRRAIALARVAEEADEVPVGALIVHRGEVIAEASNRREGNKCATHHAEILAIEEACRVLGGWRLPECTLYVTLEPCPMCAGAILNARIERVVYGAADLRAGAMGTVLNINDVAYFQRAEVVSGVLGDECRELLSSYFKGKRARAKAEKAGEN